MPLMPGSRLGAYEVIAPLGAGGMGEVYRARDSRIGRDVALKVLPEVVSRDEERIRRFEQEARAAGVLNHPNLVVVYDVGTTDGVPFLVTELLEGETLRERMLAGTTRRQTLAVASAIATGLAAAHEKGIIHRDLKPENIFITSDERVKVLDFGLAKLFGDAGEPSEATALKQTDPGVVVGTPGYMSPEQLRGSTVDERTDIFSLGIVLAEMSGRHPFRGESSAVTNSAILGSDPEIPDGCAPDLTRVLHHMLEKQPSRRFQSMKDVVFALELLAGGVNSSSSARSEIAAAAAAGASFEEITYRRLTFRRGSVINARFAPDGSVIYGAVWGDDEKFDIYACVPGNPESRPLMIPGADILAISPSGELALSLNRRIAAGWAYLGTLARRPLVGGAPRQVAESIQDADWSPDGKSLAVIRVLDDGYAIEYPMGRVVRRSDRWVSHVRVSRDGQKLAFVEHPYWGDDAGRVCVIDLEGNSLLEGATSYASTAGIAWSADGSEVWAAAERPGRGREIVGTSLKGRERVVLAVASRSTLYDVSSKGEVLLSQDSSSREIIAGRRNGELKQLAWFDWSFLSDITHDGSKILIEEQGLARREVRSAIYERATDGSPAAYLGDGRARAFSPDGRWVVADTDGVEMEIIPTGVGESRRVKPDRALQLTWWYWPWSDERLILWGNEPGRPSRVWEMDLNTGVTEPFGAEGAKWPISIAPDWQRIATEWSDGLPRMFVRGTDEGTPVPGCRKGDRPLRWSADGSSLFLVGSGRSNVYLDRLDLATGEREPWVTLRPLDSAGVLDIMPSAISPDGEWYAFGYRRLLSELYVVTGLR